MRVRFGLVGIAVITSFVVGACGGSSATLSPAPSQATPAPTDLPVIETLPPVDTEPPVATEEPTQAPSGEQTIYVVKKGDTLWAIAIEYGITLKVLQDANPDVNPRTLHVGQKLVIPGQ